MPRPKPTERFRITTFKNASGSTSYRLSGTRPDGSRVRSNFANEADALQAKAEEVRAAAGAPNQRQLQRTSLTPQQLSDAETAVRATPHRPLARTVSRLTDLEARAQAKGVDLDAALSFFESHYRAETTVISVLNARKEFIDTRVGLSPKTLYGYKSSTGLLLNPDPNKPLHRFTVADIETILARYNNINSKKVHRRAFSVFFGWAVRHHYCLENPCDRLDRLPKTTTHISILTPDEVTRLLTAAMHYHDGVAVAGVAIALFAGLRPSELADLQAGDIIVIDKRIRVSGGKMRREINRYVPIPPNLAAWLKKYPFRGLPGGWDYKMKRLKAATNARNWVQDILRHTSISYQSERDKNEGLTAYNNGTSPQMMDSHYRNVIDNPAAIKAYWALTPSTLPKNIEVTLPADDKVTWPTGAKLTKLVWQKPMSHLAKELGVTDVAIKKHCVKAGIKLPSLGHWQRVAR
jgi:integrase